MSTYVEDNLLPEESVQYEAKLHWIVKAVVAVFGIPPILLGMVVAVVFIVGSLSTPGDVSDGVIAVAIFGVLFHVVPGVLILWIGWLWARSLEFAVTDKRLISKRGIFRIDTEELLRPKVESIRVHQGIGGRVLGYGTVVVRGTGGSWEPFRLVAKPFDLRRAIQDDSHSVQPQ